MDLLGKVTRYIKNNAAYTSIINTYTSRILGVDHIAFRSLYQGQHQFSPDCIQQPDVYLFPQYDVKAHWYKNKHVNRVFSSYYQGPLFQDVFARVQQRRFGDLYSYSDYKTIYKQNQYVAWTLLHGDDINHIAIQVDDIYDLVTKMRSTYVFNGTNDVFQVSPDKKLIQASTVASLSLYNFTDGPHLVPHSFIEFVQRIDGRDGFAESSANAIMHSTRR